MTSSPQQASPVAGQKRKNAPSSPAPAKRGKTSDDHDSKAQSTLEETLDKKNGRDEPQSTKEGKEDVMQEDEKPQQEDKQPHQNGNAEKEDPIEEEKKESTEAAVDGTTHTGDEHENGTSAPSSDEKRDAPPSLLEKGLIYFFARPRVNIDHPTAVSEIARTFIVMRPLPSSSKLSDEATLSSESNANRLIALPKKTLPRDERDKFMVFTEKAPASLADLKEYLSSPSAPDSNAARTPSCIPAGEGVYTLSSSNATTHLSYKLTLPSEPSELQKALRIQQSTHVVLSAKNPVVKGPSNADLGKKVDYSKDILSGFAGKAWGEANPEMLGTENAQFLIIGTEGETVIGEKKEDDDETHGKAEEEMAEEIETLEEEDEKRLKGSKMKEEERDALFKELGMSTGEVKTTW